MTQVALVTGASSGIGQAAARALAAAGFQVFGTSRAAGAASDEPFEMLALDVRSEASVAEAVGRVLEQTGRIDVLVNNAGVSQPGAVEEVSVGQAQAQFDTNVFGVLRVTQAVLPTMRAQGSGRIINISSVLGQVAPPYLGVYASSKFAIEGLSEALRGELRPLGIWVSLVEPAFVKTKLAGERPAAPLDAYSRMAFARDGLARGLDARVVGELIVRIARERKPGLRHRVGTRAVLLTTLKRLLPENVFERVSQRVFQPQAR
jgi:NAD(P)-dependent dehydrogenase (short-subunit alcohol dehydrogenase family)